MLECIVIYVFVRTDNSITNSIDNSVYNSASIVCNRPTKSTLHTTNGILSFRTHERFLLSRFATKITNFVSIRIQTIGETLVTIKTLANRWVLLRATGWLWFRQYKVWLSLFLALLTTTNKSLLAYCSRHSNIKFISSRHRVKSLCILCNMTRYLLR